MEAQAAFVDPVAETPDLPRSRTGLRVFYTAVFVGVLQIVAVLLAALVLFQLLFALVTCKPPHARLGALGDVLTRYTGDVLRYITHNEDEAPFPFADLPEKSPDGARTEPLSDPRV